MSDKKPDSPFCNCLYFTANALGRAMTSMAEEEFAPLGLNPSQAFLLMQINKHPGIRPGELSEMMLLSPSTITRLLDKLELKKFIERKGRGREVALYPTSKSEVIQEDLMKHWSGLNKSYSDLLGKRSAKQLTRDSYSASKTLLGL
jgi:DNA-binding MarR family transcriptional regulator